MYSSIPFALAVILGLLSTASATPLNSTRIEARDTDSFVYGVRLYAPAWTYVQGLPKKGEKKGGWGGWGYGSPTENSMARWFFKFKDSYQSEKFELWTYEDNGDWDKDKNPEEMQKLVVSGWL